MARNDRLFDHLRACTPSQQMLLWSQDLQKAPEDEDFASSSPQKRVELLSAEIRSVAGHSLMNRFRGAHEMPWREILDSVLDTLGLSDGQQAEREKMSDVQIEQVVLSRFDELVEEASQGLSNDERAAAMQGIEARIAFEKRVSETIFGSRARTQMLKHGLAPGAGAAPGIGAFAFSSGSWFLRAVPIVGALALPVTIANAFMLPSQSKLLPAVVRLLSLQTAS